MIDAFDRYIMRTPLLSFDVLRTIKTQEQLLTFFRQPVMLEAIYLASPALHEALLKNNPDDKLIASLMKYLQRAATRCTPFGLFAACSVVPAGEKNNPGLFNFNQKRHTRPDMNYLCALAQHFAVNPLIRSELTFYPNTSIYRTGDKIRYTEYTYYGAMRQHKLSNVDQSLYIDIVLRNAASGKKANELAALLTGDDVSAAEAEAFIDELIDAQLLVSNLDSSVTGPEFFEQIIDALNRIDKPEIAIIKDILDQVKQDLSAMDMRPPGADVTHYRTIGENLKQLGVSFDWKFLFQVDMFRETNLEAGEKIGADLLSGIKVLCKLSTPNENPNLKSFLEAFSSRYDSREVPLMQALDTENGLGYPYSDNRQHDLCPLIDGINPEPGQVSVFDVKWTPAHTLLLDKFIAAQQQGEQVITITDADVQGLNFDEAKMPDTFSAMCSVTSFDHETAGMQIHLQLLGESSAVNLMGRFCHGDPEIEKLARDITAHENALNPDVLFAEVVHLPESRIGNVLSRPILRKYEIPYLAKSIAPKSDQLELEDLTLAVRNGKLVLRSVKHNKMVIPRLGNAHNYSNRSLPVYHFLCDLQNHYHTAEAGIDLHFFMRRFSFIPRITYRNIIFAPASWQFRISQLSHLFKLTGNALEDAIQTWRKQYKIPVYQVLPDSDNELFIDWSNLLSVKSLFDAIRNRDEIRLTEFLFDPGNPFLKNESGFYTNQFIVSYKQAAKKQQISDLASLKPLDSLTVQRDFQPGSEWLYFKIYTGIKTADRILTELLLPFMQQLKATAEIQTYFFIRYGDPRDHIRFRVHCRAGINRTDILQRFYNCLAPACENGLIAQIQLDTYQRELERYGAGTIELAEQLFEMDSELALQIISHLDGDYGDSIRWKIGLLIIDSYFKAFRLDAESIIAFTGNQAAAFEAEFNFGKDQRIQMDKSYREKRSAVEYVLKGEYTADDECSPLYELVNAFRTQLYNNAVAIYEKAGAASTIAYLPSFIHMSVNRFFRSRQRLHELLVYTFLHKYYTSVVARQKKAKTTQKQEHV